MEAIPLGAAACPLLDPLARSRIGVRCVRVARHTLDASEHLSCSRSPALRIYAIFRPWALASESDSKRVACAYALPRSAFATNSSREDGALCCAAAASFGRDPWRCRVRDSAASVSSVLAFSQRRPHTRSFRSVEPSQMAKSILCRLHTRTLSQGIHSALTELAV